MDGAVEVVDYDLDDVAFIDDEGVDCAVDLGDRGVWGAEGCEQGGDFLSNVGDVVEICSTPMLVVEWLLGVGKVMNEPGYSIGIYTELEVQSDLLVDCWARSEECQLVKSNKF